MDEVIIAGGKFKIIGITEGNFSVFGCSYHTQHITAGKCAELIAKGCSTIVAVEPADKKANAAKAKDTAPE